MSQSGAAAAQAIARSAAGIASRAARRRSMGPRAADPRRDRHGSPAGAHVGAGSIRARMSPGAELPLQRAARPRARGLATAALACASLALALAAAEAIARARGVAPWDARPRRGTRRARRKPLPPDPRRSAGGCGPALPRDAARPASPSARRTTPPGTASPRRPAPGTRMRARSSGSSATRSATAGRSTTRRPGPGCCSAPSRSSAS